MRAVKVEIYERANHWAVVGLGQAEVTLSSAADALRFVRCWAQEQVEAGESTAITIEWLPTTRVGRWVVAALQAHK